MRKLNHDLIRIGEARSEIGETEPLFRDSDLITFDISAVRQSDAPGTFAPSPNGFYTEEICLLSRYAGLSDKLKIFGLFEVNPVLDSRYQTSSLAAQILWFMLEGVSQRTPEAGLIGKDRNGRFVQYHVSINDLDVGRNVSEVIRLLDALQTGELTPCNWHPGEETFFPCSGLWLEIL